MRSIKVMKDRVRMDVVAALFVIVSGVGAADAQQRSTPTMMDEDRGMMMGRGMEREGMRGPGMMMCHMGEHVEGHLAYLKAELKITDAQMPQWNAFADAFRASGQKTMKHCAMMKEHAEKKTHITLPDRLNMVEQHLTTHLEALRGIKTAAQQLYSVLSDEQKKIADQMIGHMGMM